MPANDRILLEQLLEQRKSEIAPNIPDSEFFELFVASEVLKDHNLSYDELSSGFTSGGNDGGVDGFWLFANGDLVREDSDLSHLRRGVELELVVIQAKQSNGFKEEPINKLITFTENLLDLSNDVNDFTSRYNESLLEAVMLFRRVYQNLASSFPNLHIQYYYATLGDEVHPNTQAKARDLKNKVRTIFSSVNPSFTFLGASELLELARKQPKRTFELRFSETPLIAGDAVAYVCLVRLTDFFAFITDDDGRLRAELFESNVRDFQGNTEVNREIRTTLESRGTEDFWWLNNGITILASKVTQIGRVLTLEDPQIVNGLQTSRQIFEHFSSNEGRDDDRLVLVRVIVPEDEGSRDKIIKATNSQTYIPPASLKATDKIQRDIEEYLKSRGLYYDRRKNYYKNAGKPVADIISIPKMAQAMMAIVLQRPDTARARPSSLIKSESDYSRLFNVEYPIEVYYSCIRLVRIVENYLRSLDTLEQKDRNNVRFYIALELARELTGEKNPSVTNLAQIAEVEISEALVDQATSRVLEIYDKLGRSDQIAKGTELKRALDSRWGNNS